MRYKRNAGASNPRQLWIDMDQVRADIAADPRNAAADISTNYTPFTPYSNLNDCWKAEEKMWTTKNWGPNLRQYEKQLELLVFGTSLEDVISHVEQSKDDYMKFMLHHATAPQKCEAMLRAMGEVE